MTMSSSSVLLDLNLSRCVAGLDEITWSCQCCCLCSNGNGLGMLNICIYIDPHSARWYTNICRGFQGLASRTNDRMKPAQIGIQNHYDAEIWSRSGLTNEMM